MKELNSYIPNLVKDIKLAYSKAFSKHQDKKSWPQACESAMRKFILSRDGWSQARGDVVYTGSSPVEISIIYSGSPAILMIDTAIAIAKAELAANNDLSSEQRENQMDQIEEEVKSQNWIIGFSRTKLK